MSFWSGTHTPKSVAWLDRNSQLEGSFGKEKEHYHLKKVKA